MSWSLWVVGGLVLLSRVSGIGQEPAALPPSLNPHLEPLRPLVGTTWRGEFANSTREKPVIDVVTYERAMNGQAIRALHSINDGEYGGESLIYWDDEAKSLAYFYLTTAGFRTEGRMTTAATGTGFTSLETVKGNAGGITRVRASGTLRPDGKLLMTSEYEKGGTWEKGRETLYVRDDAARVRFR